MSTAENKYQNKLRMRRAKFGTVVKPILREVGKEMPKVTSQRTDETGDKAASKNVKAR